MYDVVNDVIKCGDKLYYDINPDSKMDVPSAFYEWLETDWAMWKVSDSEISFYEYCKNKYLNKNE